MSKKRRRNEVESAIEYFNMHIEVLELPGHKHRTFEFLGKVYTLAEAKQTLKELQTEFIELTPKKKGFEDFKPLFPHSETELL